MDWLDDRVQRGGEEAVDKVRAGHRFRLGASVAFELGPDAGEGGQRSFVVRCELDDVLGLRIGLGAYWAKH